MMKSPAAHGLKSAISALGQHSIDVLSLARFQCAPDSLPTPVCVPTDYVSGLFAVAKLATEANIESR